MESVTRVQNLHEAVGVLFCPDGIGKGINPSLFRPAMDKIAGQTYLFCFGIPVKQEEKY